MSKVACLHDGFAGWTDGEGNLREILLSAGTEWDSDSDIVRSRPDLFTAPAKKAAPKKSMRGAEDD